MIAITLIQDWLAQQDPRVQAHLSSTVLAHLGFSPDLIAARDQTPCARLQQWLSGAAGAPSELGRILTLRALVDFCFGDRFTGDGWSALEALYRAVEDDPGARPPTRALAADSLAALPALKLEWVRAGRAWGDLTRTALSDVSLGLGTTIAQLPVTRPAPASSRALVSAGEPS
jgi:hypothetical protein